MKHHERSYPRLSACGLNCGLCPRYHTDGTSRCPGCGGAGFFEKRPPCGVLSCCARHGEIEYCFECGEYPCAKLQGAEDIDSFITHRNMRANFEAVKTAGLGAYRAALDEKVAILEHLLTEYNDGRRGSFLCLAVNLLDLRDVREIAAQLDAQVSDATPLKERAALAAQLFGERARLRGIELTLRKKGGGR